MFDSKRRVAARRIKIDFFYMSNRRKPRTCCQIVLESFDTLRRPFHQSFDPAVIKILHETNDLMPRRCALREKPEAYALHVAADEKSSRDLVGHCVYQENSILAPRYQLNNHQTARRNVDDYDVSHPALLRDIQRLISCPLGRA